ncbi:tRNA lysidine(34) synthetase TilS [Ramlibacter sp. USB13]|uniref:tRNA(Ile)-lysidine synthase n=1 Tax=Ramlibacter cellulosilyticus TaxID=2764187 RepID=A0A923SD70_9BURK|nr:tRNA lysidine(34) synthetase TilS [Ramlibacter cellulosilyticus]MBC5785023.1 tRNA lysidine(34) synthetase TilS [Ramlibacter cellulosilyticus]
MAASQTPRLKPADPAGNPAVAALAGLELPLPLAVAFSGGADSTVLLLAAAARWPGQVQAIHVHHGLQEAADAFEQHCKHVCAELGIPLHVRRVHARNALGESPEDAARNARYQALARAARDAELKAVLLGQHADDQVETLLLALSRGAGLPGLAAMPPVFQREGMVFVRPLLALSARAIREWIAEQGVLVVEDPTNTDTSFTRNRIRRVVLPALEECFPQYRETFARTSRHAAQAQELLESVAVEDLARMGGTPALTALQVLPRARQGNVLRHWLRSAHQAQASAAQLEELLDQVADCRTRGHKIRIKVGGGFVERSGERLAYRDESA